MYKVTQNAIVYLLQNRNAIYPSIYYCSILHSMFIHSMGEKSSNLSFSLSNGRVQSPLRRSLYKGHACALSAICKLFVELEGRPCCLRKFTHHEFVYRIKFCHNGLRWRYYTSARWIGEDEKESGKSEFGLLNCNIT